MRRIAVLTAAIGLLIAAPAAHAAEPRSETASAGAVAATLTYTFAEVYEATGVHLAITRDGAPAPVARDGDVAVGCRFCTGAMPVGGLEGSEADSLTVADLDGDGEPEVIVDLFTGGAHCCSVSAIYRWDPQAGYQRLTHLWGDPGYRLQTLPGVDGQAFVTADHRFAYAFCAYVCSAMPQRIMRYRAGRLVDVTRDVPARVRSDLRAWRAALRSAQRHRADRFAIRGILPAVCADLYLLRRGAQCRGELDRALRRGWLARDRAMGDTWPSGRAYVTKVLAFLAKTGYRR